MKRKLTRHFHSYSLQIIVIVLASSVLFFGALFADWIMLIKANEKTEYLSQTPSFKIWKSKQLNHYSYLLDSDCLNAKNLRIEVRDNVQVWPRTGDYPTIDDLFQFLDNASAKADYLDAYYHPIGYPHHATIVWDENAFDLLCGFRVSQFQALSGIGLIPTLNAKQRIKEPRFWPPGMLGFDPRELDDLGYGLPIKEEFQKLTKKNVLPKSVTDDVL